MEDGVWFFAQKRQWNETSGCFYYFFLFFYTKSKHLEKRSANVSKELCPARCPPRVCRFSGRVFPSWSPGIRFVCPFSSRRDMARVGKHIHHIIKCISKNAIVRCPRRTAYNKKLYWKSFAKNYVYVWWLIAKPCVLWTEHFYRVHSIYLIEKRRSTICKWINI